MNFEEYYDILIKGANDERNTYYYDNIKNYGDYPVNGSSGYTYEFANLKYYNELNKRFNLTEIAGNNDTVTKALNIMNWITQNTYYNGYSSLPPSGTDEIIAYSFNKGFKGAINCANKAILLSDCLMSAGIFALPVWIDNHVVDFDSKYFDCGVVHVVDHVFIPEKNKWIMLDPSFNSYIADKNNNILNLIEIRSIYKRSNSIKDLVLKNYSLNGSDDLFKKYYVSDFIIKLLFTIETWYGNEYGKRNLHEDCLLMPYDFDYITYFKNRASVCDNENERYNLLHYSENIKRTSVKEFLADPSIVDSK